MSKVDAQRAMREARYAAYAAARAATGTTATNPPPATARVTPARPPAPGEGAAPSSEGVTAPADLEANASAPAAPAEPGAEPGAQTPLCGHRNIGNKSCRRPAGHAEKNHRYK